MGPIYWLILLVVLVIVEAITMGLSTIWFAGGALAAFIASWLGAPIVLQVALFLVISVVLLVFTRPFAVRYLDKTRVKTNVDSLIGKKAVVSERVENIHGTGHVKVQGLEWTARSTDDEVALEKDEVVTIVRVEGVKLIVERRGGE